MSARPTCILISALGGQGGGVLLDWLASAARAEGLPAQSTSIPGLAQRTGATTYYFEVYPDGAMKARPHFSIYPASGAVDLLLAFEPMEAGRALANGFVGPETTVITAHERVVSTAEKMLPGDGVRPAGPVLAALARRAGKLRVVDMGGTARAAGSAANAVMLGALAASGVAPMQPETFRAAIVGSGVAVKRNLAGFEAGLTMPALPQATIDAPAAQAFDPAPRQFAAMVAALPPPVQPMAGHAAARLLDYQGPAYATLFLDRLNRLVALDRAEENWRLSLCVARRLGAWMAFEDVIRVAQLKTRPGRLARIRKELGLAADAPLTVHDFLKPGRDEALGMLPAQFSGLLHRGKPPAYGEGFKLRLRTTGPVGWALLRLLAGLRSWRPYTARFRAEQQAIETWLGAIAAAAPADYPLACDTAELGAWARGYGETRRRGLDRLAVALADYPARLRADALTLGNAIRKAVAAAHDDPDTEVTR